MSARRDVSRRWPVRLYAWAAERLYYEFAWAYDAVSWLVSLGHWAGWRRMALEYVDGHRVLEIGFGTGELLIEMARRSLSACGLERSPAMQRVTARKMRRRGVRAPRVRGEVQRAPFADGCFDSIVSTFPSPYILDPVTLRETARLLRPPHPGQATGGGRLVVVGMVLDTDSRFLRRVMGFIFGGDGESVLAHYKRIATAAGLRVTVTVRSGRGLSRHARIPVVIAEKQA